MPRETFTQKRERSAAISAVLRQTYPDAHCELQFSNPLELLVATILSAQCTDKLVNRVTADLFRKYRTAQDYSDAPVEQLAADIRQIGLFRNKARFIQACCRSLVERHDGQVPRDMEALTALAGVGRKTANVVLGNAFGINAGVVVDTHVARLTARLRLSAESSPEAIERDLKKLIPADQWTVFSHWLIWHGRRRCRARNPDCTGCEIRRWCPTGAKKQATLPV